MSIRWCCSARPERARGLRRSGFAERLRVPTISTGDIFRANQAGDTELGRKVVGYTSTGRLVPES